VQFIFAPLPPENIPGQAVLVPAVDRFGGIMRNTKAIIGRRPHHQNAFGCLELGHMHLGWVRKYWTSVLVQEMIFWEAAVAEFRGGRYGRCDNVIQQI